MHQRLLHSKNCFVVEVTFKDLMTHFLLAIMNLLPIAGLYIFDIQYSVGRTFILSGVDIEKC